MAEERVLSVTAHLRGHEVEIFEKLKEHIAAQYNNTPGFRLSNSVVVRTVLLLFADYFRAKARYDLLVQLLREKSPELLREFETRAKEMGI